MNLQEIADLFKSSASLDTKEVSKVVIDSRQASKGSLFVALRGQNFDGHDFIKNAEQNGAIAAIVERHKSDVNIPQLIVSNTEKALGDLARYHRQKFDLPVIALTGSNGKTSVKEMIGAMLPAPSFVSFANFNNQLGVPLNILSLGKEHKFAVFELGASAKGEITYTVDLVKPKITLVNNIGPAHIGGFGSIEGVAEAKSEIYAALPQDGFGIINADDIFCDFFHQKLLNKNVIKYSALKSCDVYAEDIQFDSIGRANFILNLFSAKKRVFLKVPGMHNVSNALAAAASVASLKISFENIINGLEKFNGVAGRMAFKQGKNNSLIIDDTYNANLKSVSAALQVIAKYDGEKIFVLGDMLELGELAVSHHAEVGKKAKELGINKLFTFGQFSEHASLSFGQNSKHYVSKKDLIDDLCNCIGNDSKILIKGSRSLKMEEVVNAIKD